MKLKGKKVLAILCAITMLAGVLPNGLFMKQVEAESSVAPSADLKEITFRDFGIADGEYAGAYSLGYSQYAYSETSLDGTLFNGDITFSDGFQPELCFGNVASSGEASVNKGIRGLRIYRDTSNPTKLFMYNYFPNATFADCMTFDPAIAGTTLIGQEFNLKISVQFVGEDADSDGIKDDVKLGFWFNDVLYNNQYKELTGQAKYFGNRITFFNYYSTDTTKNGPITVKSIEKLPDKNLKEITFRDFGIKDGDYAGEYSFDVTKGTYIEDSLDGTVFNGDIKFSEGFQPEFCFGNGYTVEGLINANNRGLRIYRDTANPDRLFMYDYLPGGTATNVSFDPKVAGTTLIGEEFNLKISVQFVGEDTDSDGRKDDVKLGIWFNDLLYNDTYITLTGQAKYFGNKITMFNYYNQDTSVNGPVTVKSTKEQQNEELKEITFRDFGISDGEYASEYSFAITKGTYGEASLDGTLFNGDITFSDGFQPELCFGCGYTAEGLVNSSIRGLRIYRDTANPTGLYMYNYLAGGSQGSMLFRPETAGTTLIGEEFNLKISVEFVDSDTSDEDATEDDIKLGVWFNDKLYDGKYIYIEGQASYLGNQIALFNYYSADITKNGPIAVKSIQKESDEELSEISFNDLGITEGIYTSDVEGAHPLAGSLVNYKFSADIKFTGEQACMYYGSKSSNTDGLCFSFEKEGIILTAGSDTYTFVDEVAGTSLYGNTLNLQIGLLWLDLDGDGTYDDAQLTVYINGKLYDNRVIYLDGIVSKLGAKIYIQPTNATLELSSPAAYNTSNMMEVTSADFGIADGTYDGVSGELLESVDFKKFSGTVTLASVGDYVEYAGVKLLKTAEDTLQVQRGEYNQLYELNVTEDTFTLDISTEYIDCDADRWADDAKMCIWINGQQLGEEYFLIYHSESLCKTAQLKVKGTITSEKADMSYSCDAFVVDADNTETEWSDFSAMKLVSGSVNLPSEGANVALTLTSGENVNALTFKRVADGTITISGLTDEDVVTETSAEITFTYACLLQPVDMDCDGIDDDVAIRVWLNGTSIQNRQWFWYGCIAEDEVTTLNVVASEGAVMEQWLPETDLQYTYHDLTGGAYDLKTLTGSGEIVINRVGGYYAGDALSLGDYVIVTDAFRTEMATPVVVWKLGCVNADSEMDVKDLIAAKKIEINNGTTEFRFAMKGANLDSANELVDANDMELLRKKLVE